MSNRLILNGVDAYQEWHSKDPTKLTTIKTRLPDTVYQLGRAEMIAYRSGKWHDGNKTDDWEHHFDSRPFIYHEDGEGRSKSVSSMIRKSNPSDFDDVDNPKNLPVLVDLGKCIELTFTVSGGEVHKITLGRSFPKMCCTTDKKTLVILHKDGPIFIKGGQMRITERGIVK